jgi:hypothetical protein
VSGGNRECRNALELRNILVAESVRGGIAHTAGESRVVGEYPTKEGGISACFKLCVFFIIPTRDGRATLKMLRRKSRTQLVKHGR